MQATLNSLRQPPAVLQSTLASYQKAMEKRATVEPLITILNNLQGIPSVPTLLASIKLARPPGVVILSMAVKQEKDTIQLSLKGTIAEHSLADAQTQLETLCTSLTTTKGLTLTNRSLDPNTRIFTVEANYKP
jgi:hypothetical protein